MQTLTLSRDRGPVRAGLGMSHLSCWPCTGSIEGRLGNREGEGLAGGEGPEALASEDNNTGAVWRVGEWDEGHSRSSIMTAKAMPEILLQICG